MATFAKATFDVASYLARRPTYPDALYDLIYAYHARPGGWAHVLDLGCGPGFVAVALSHRFARVTALDPARRMVDAGLRPARGAGEVEYRVGAAEDLRAAGVEDGSVDLIVAAQAAHWFDYARAWPSLLRALRPGGTVAFIAYAEMCLPTHPVLDALITAYSAGTLGAYWSQPGRGHTERLLDDVAFPVAVPDAADLPELKLALALPGLEGGVPVRTRVREPVPVCPDDAGWDAASAVRLKAEVRAGKTTPWLLRKTMDRPALDGYLRTWSAFHAYAEEHPERRGADVVDRLVDALAPAFDDAGTIDVAWPLGVMMIKKRA
ncbi:hypothetical protein Q5752_002236 [Cryptotrichosporon argae]